MDQRVAWGRVGRLELQRQRSAANNSVRLLVNMRQLFRHVPETTRARAVENRTVLQQVSVEVQANVGLQTFRKALQYGVHVDSVGVRPGVLEVLLQTLPQRIRYLMEADEFSYAKHLRVVTGGARVQALDDGRDVAEDAGVHQSLKRF